MNNEFEKYSNLSFFMDWQVYTISILFIGELIRVTKVFKAIEKILLEQKWQEPALAITQP